MRPRGYGAGNIDNKLESCFIMQRATGLAIRFMHRVFTKKWRASIAGIAVIVRSGTTARIAQQSRLENRVVDLAWRCEYGFRRTRMLVTAEAAQRTLHRRNWQGGIPGFPS